MPHTKRVEARTQRSTLQKFVSPLSGLASKAATIAVGVLSGLGVNISYSQYCPKSMANTELPSYMTVLGVGCVTPTWQEQALAI